MRCQKCGHEKQVLGGCSAHEDNWYCEVCELRARVAELEAERNLLPNIPISGAMRREWECIMLRPFTSASEEAFRAMLRAALAGKQPQEGE